MNKKTFLKYLRESRACSLGYSFAKRQQGGALSVLLALVNSKSFLSYCYFRWLFRRIAEHNDAPAVIKNTFFVLERVGGLYKREGIIKYWNSFRPYLKFVILSYEMYLNVDGKRYSF